MNKTSIIRNQTFDEERALYGSRDLLVEDSSFDGPADGRALSRNAAIFRHSAVSLISAIPSGMIMG